MRTNVSKPVIKKEQTGVRVWTRQTKDDALNLHPAEPRLGRVFRGRRSIVAVVTGLAALGLCAASAQLAHAVDFPATCGGGGGGLVVAITNALGGDNNAVVLDSGCTYLINAKDNGGALGDKWTAGHQQNTYHARQ
jgi:hypothetical protein